METERARELLGAERRRIERGLGRAAHEDDGEPADEFDPGNLASDLYQDELDEGREADLREQLAALERAEERLAAGTYGFSVESGDVIPDERLEAVPTAELTVEEERRLSGR
jgi:DnaK suppressor protein